MKKYIILTLVVVLFGCVNEQDKNSRFTEKQIASLQLDSTQLLTLETDSIITVDLNPFLNVQSFEFDSLIKEIKMIPLETTEESLLDAIYKVLITDSTIYIHDRFKGGGIVVFDRKGKFIKRIPHGQGPGELVRLYDIAYDFENNELVAYMHSFLLFFTPSGQFTRQLRLPFGFYNFTVTPQGYVFKSLHREGNGHLGSLQDYTLLVTDKSLRLKSVAMPVLPSDVNFIGYNYLYKTNNIVNVTQNFTDTVYQYISETNQLKAKFALDYSNKKLPDRYTRGTFNEFENAAEQNDYYFYIGEYFETESNNIFLLCNFHTGWPTIVYRDKKSGNMIGGTGTECNINEIPPIGFPVSVSDNYFICTYLPGKNDLFLTNSSMISDEDKLNVKSLKEDDNPVLVLYTLKAF